MRPCPPPPPPPPPPPDITLPAHTALAAGCEGIAAINTITSVMGINLDTLRPEPCGGWGAGLCWGAMSWVQAGRSASPP